MQLGTTFSLLYVAQGFVDGHRLLCPDFEHQGYEMGIYYPCDLQPKSHHPNCVPRFFFFKTQNYEKTQQHNNM